MDELDSDNKLKKKSSYMKSKIFFGIMCLIIIGLGFMGYSINQNNKAEAEELERVEELKKVEVLKKEKELEMEVEAEKAELDAIFDEYGVIAISTTDLFVDGMTRFNSRFSEVAEDLSLLLDSEWRNEFIMLFEEFEEMYSVFNDIEDIPEGFEEYHEHMLNAIEYMMMARSPIMNGLFKRDGDLIDKARELIQESNAQMELVNEILVIKKKEKENN